MLCLYFFFFLKIAIYKKIFNLVICLLIYFEVHVTGNASLLCFQKKINTWQKKMRKCPAATNRWKLTSQLTGSIF